MLLAPAFLNDGDQDHDGKLSEAEFKALAQKWYGQWDKAASGSVDLDQLRSGLNTTFSPPGGGPRGGGPGGGGRGFAMNLQGPEGKRNGLAAAAGINFEYVHADLDFGGQVFKDVAVRYKGNGTFMQSRDSLKRSLKVDLDKFKKGQSLGGVSKLDFHNNVTDASWMNEVLSHRLFRDAGVPAPRTAYARVYVTVPGEFDRKYFGLYSLVESVDQDFIRERFNTKQGAIFKPVTPTPFIDLGDDWKQYQQTYDPKTNLTPEQKRRVIELSKLVSHAQDGEFNEKLGSYIDLDEFARFMAVEVWLATLDSILSVGQNYYVYLTPGKQQFQFIPWDLDHSFGQFFLMGTQTEREQLSIHHPWRGENRFLERVFANDTFKKTYLGKLAEFSKDVFAPDRISQQVDEIAAIIRPAVKEESPEKLARFDQVVAGTPVAPAGFGRGFGGPPPGEGGQNGPGARPPREGGPGFGAPFFQSASPIKPFVKARAASVSEQLAGRSQGSQIPDFGFGPPGGRGGRGPQGGFGPGMFLGPAFLQALDSDRDQKVSRDEALKGFESWFQKWKGGEDKVNDEQLRAGINQEFSPPQ